MFLILLSIFILSYENAVVNRILKKKMGFFVSGLYKYRKCLMIVKNISINLKNAFYLSTGCDLMVTPRAFDFIIENCLQLFDAFCLGEIGKLH